MKIKGIILLVMFFVYFFNSTLAVFQINHKKEAKSCCMKMMAQHKIPSKCPTKQKDCTTDCFNCPFFYLSTIAPSISITANSIYIQNHYSSLTVSALNDFNSEHWQPPESKLI